MSTLALWMPATNEAVVFIDPPSLVGVNCVIAYFWLLVLMFCDKESADVSANDPCSW